MNGCREESSLGRPFMLRTGPRSSRHPKKTGRLLTEEDSAHLFCRSRILVIYVMYVGYAVGRELSSSTPSKSDDRPRLQRTDTVSSLDQLTVILPRVAGRKAVLVFTPTSTSPLLSALGNGPELPVGDNVRTGFRHPYLHLSSLGSIARVTYPSLLSFHSDGPFG